jgi:tetratricopeptide (TPR) repeat protein
MISLSSIAISEDRLSDADEAEASVLQAARVELRSSDVAAARQTLDKYCEENSDSPLAEIMFASLLLEVRQDRAAIELLTEVSRRDGTEFEVHSALARIAFRQNRWMDAWAHATVARRSEIPKRWSESYRSRSITALKRVMGLTAVQRQDWSVAHELLRTLVQNDKQDAVAAMSFGVAAFHLDKLDLAKRSLQLAAEIDSTHAPYQLALAKLHSGVGREEVADATMREAINVAGKPGQVARLTHAEWLLAKNNSQAASETLKKVKDPSIVDQRDFLLGLAHRMRGEFDEAETLFARLHQKEPTNTRFSNQLALALIESQDEGKRGRALQIATTNVGRLQTADTVSTAAWVSYRLGDPVQAEKLLDTLIRTGSISRDGAFYASQIKRSLGKREQAERFLSLSRGATGAFFNAQKADASGE